MYDFDRNHQTDKERPTSRSDDGEECTAGFGPKDPGSFWAVQEEAANLYAEWV